MVKRTSKAVQPKVEPGMVQVQEETKRTFVEPLSIDTEGQVIDIEEEKDDWKEAFLKRQREEGFNYVLRIERLPMWGQDGKSGVRAEREFIAAWPFTEDLANSYEDRIQQSYGGGHYQLELRNQLNIESRWTVHIANPPAPIPGLPQSLNGQPINYTVNHPQAPGAPPIDPMKMFRDQIDMAQSLVKLGQSFTPPPGVQAPLVPVDPNNSPAVVELRTRMEMFEKIAGLAPEKQAPLVQLVKGLGLLGEEASEGTGLQWMRIIEGLTPVINMGMALLMQRLGGAAPLAPQTPGAPPPQGALPPQPAEPQVPVDPAGVMLAQVVNLIGTGIAQGQSSNPAEAAIEELVTNFPNSQAAQQCELILTRPPQEVAAQLGLAHPDAVRWLGVLQTNWKQHEAEDVEDERDPTPPEVLSFGGAE